MKSGSIRISKGGNRIHLTGSFANDFFKAAQAAQPKLYIFHRADGFYPLELQDDADAIANANNNAGTIKVTNASTGVIVWPLETRVEEEK